MAHRHATPWQLVLEFSTPEMWQALLTVALLGKLGVAGGGCGEVTAEQRNAELFGDAGRR